MVPSRPTVLHVFNYFAPDFTGEGIYATKMFVHLASLGIENEVLVTRSHPSVAGACARLTTPAPHTIHYLPYRLSRRSPELQLAFWLLRHGRRYNVVHYHSHCDRRFLSLLVARTLGLRVLMSCTLDDSPGAVLGSYKPGFRWLAKRLLRLVNTFVSISPKLHGDPGGVVPDDRHLLIPQGVEVPCAPRHERCRLRQELGVGDEHLVLLFVGALCERKNPIFLIEQLPAILERHPRASLYLVGPTTEDAYARRLVERANELGLAHAVRFVGFTARTEDWYAVADLMLFSSTNEGFGNVLLEAMAHGVPVVARRLPGVTDSYIVHEESGMLFDDTADYLRSVYALAADPALRERVGAKARAVAIERFPLSQVAQRYAALYTSR
ncbi:MAG TPA: glycosyltransferase family 4 protein [Planctomycetota bacterium]|nr:glycosyltransferase family 4 protein [Planctomycetota bacterium]